MPRALDLEDNQIPGSRYGYSAAHPSELTATEYTLVTIALDESGSTFGFKAELEKAIKAIVGACQYSPRADNLMLRLVAFGTSMREIHGFKPLSACNQADYDGCYGNGGSTALYDASENAILATAAYAKQLTDQDFSVNSIIFVLTDGDDNASTVGQKQVAKAQADCIKDEAMESKVSVLIGVNVQEAHLAAYLQDFKTNGGFDKYEELANANAKGLAKLAEFVSKSISSQSQALGTGGPSKAIASLTI